MKKIWKILMTAFAAFVLVACGNSASEGGSQEGSADGGTTDGEPTKIALLVQSVGDMSFNDSAIEGLERAEQDFGVEVDVIEYGDDASAVESNLLDAADAGYDVIIGASQMADYYTEYAQDYPDTQFWMFDSEFDYSQGDYSNVYAISYKSNEASYLGGYLAASTSETGHLGFMGGVENPVIQDFLVGYIQGAQAANPDITMSVAYTGSWSDTARAKDLANSMYNQDASSVFIVAGGAGTGAIEAAVETGNGKEVIGVDSDMAALFEANGQSDMAAVIPTSVLKNVGNSLYRAVDLLLKGELAVGDNEVLGLAEDGVGLAENANFEAAYPEELREEVKNIREEIVNGTIQVQSGFGMSTSEIQSLVNSVSK